MARATGPMLPVLRGRPPAELASMGRRVPVMARRKPLVRRRQPNRHVMRLTVVIRAVAVARSRRPLVVHATSRLPAAPAAPKPLKAPRPMKRGSGLLKKAQAFMRYMAD